MVYKEKGLEFLRMTLVQESAAATWTNTGTTTPISVNEKLAMIIHSVSFELESALDAVADGDSFAIVLSDRSFSQIPNINDEGVLHKIKELFKMVTSGMTKYSCVYHYTFPRPIIYARKNIYLGVLCNGQAAEKSVSANVGYTLETIDKEVFIEALVED